MNLSVIITFVTYSYIYTKIFLLHIYVRTCIRITYVAIYIYIAMYMHITYSLLLYIATYMHITYVAILYV